MDLFFRKLGKGEPIIVLHGLYGSSDNWHTIGRELATGYSVYLVDQRNHGNSPHHPDHNYNVLSDDLNEFMVSHRLKSAIIIGHSMGGKTALAFGLKYPEKVNKMIVVDISPLGYSNTSDTAIHARIIGALQAMNLDLITSREDADLQLKDSISSLAVRQFLLKNLKRMPDGKYKWALNTRALTKNMPAIFSGVIDETHTKPHTIPQFPLLFLKGAFSNYIHQRDEEAIRHFFPWATLVVIPNSGHWIHSEQPMAFLHAVFNFLGHDLKPAW